MKSMSGRVYGPDTIAFTHITTGSPTEYLKMTDRTHASVLYTIKQFHDALRPSYPKHLYTNPLFWMSSLPRDFFNGITRVSPDKWYPIKDYCELLYKIIVTEDVQYADLQPVHAAGIIEKMGKQGPLLDHLFIVGMPVSKAMLQTVKPLANWFTLGYGSHETGGTSFNILHTDDIEQFQDFDNGLPAPGVQIRIVDENWTDVCAGSKGRVLIKTPAMFSGYSMEPEKTAQRFDNEHWFITNDIGRLDERTGHLFVGGRMDSIILHGEYMIYPFWLEEMLSTHPDIKEVVIVPVSDPVLFHAIGAIVIKKPNSTLTVNDIQSKISEFIVPEVMDIVRVKHLMFVDTFPRKQDGSLDRSQLYDLMQEHVVKYFKTK
uniref:Medium-chain acyl-CoA ligase ACSF2, mitochondrial n=1 Tax=Biomphalaria glabrata TaxID=6526 RepID=A0A2C9LAU2_BIOGL